ncbi:ribonuclease Z [Candidatus Electrothrix aarhusensis]|uniref:Ribonuclease Z n=1 Tax=Candidatus Electrothrix aarhusensis TaxID=1859131 RepID=A0A444IUP1_9BACT|nr:ribonuclease Z [Candidatus Electrothrix aarhusensis]
MKKYSKQHLTTVYLFLFTACTLLVSTVPGWAKVEPLQQIKLSAPPPGALRVTLLGTAVGPPVGLKQFGISTLIEAGDKRLLFDCGRGSTIRLRQLGISIGSINKVFLTHLHSDHLIQLPDIFLAGWVMGRRNEPLKIWGPTGTSDMMNALTQAFAFDIHIRRDVDERFPSEGIRVQSHDIQEGIIFNEDGVKVTAFLVDHRPVIPAFGYRVDYGDHSVVLSGDTRVSEHLITFAKGTDVLIHEALPVQSQKKRPEGEDRAAALHTTEVEKRIMAHHTTAEQAGEIFTRVKPGLAVFSHAPNTEGLLEQVSRTYNGPLQPPEDLTIITISEQIQVQDFTSLIATQE